MRENIFYYQKVSLMSFLRYSLIGAVASFLICLIISKSIDGSWEMIIIMSLVFFGIAVLCFSITLIDLWLKLRKKSDFSFKTDSGGITFFGENGSKCTIHWNEIKTMNEIKGKELGFAKKYETYHVKVITEGHDFKSNISHLIDISLVDGYKEHDLYTILLDDWQKYLYRNESHRYVQVPKEILYRPNRWKKEIAIFSFVILYLFFSYLNEYVDRFEVISVTSIFLIVFFLILFSFIPVFMFVKHIDSLALKFLPQGIQNEGLMKSNRVLLWSGIKSINIKKKRSNLYIIIEPNNATHYLKSISLWRRVLSRIYNLFGISYLYIRSDLENCQLYDVHRVLVNEWQKHTSSPQ